MTQAVRLRQMLSVMPDCPRTLNDSLTRHFPDASAVKHSACPPWRHEQDSAAFNSSRSVHCATITHLSAGYGSYIHHTLHGIFLARRHGLRLVPTLHPSVVRTFKQASVRDAFFGGALSGCNEPLLSCLVGSSAPCVSTEHLSMLGQAKYRFSLHEVGSAVLELLEPSPALDRFLGATGRVNPDPVRTPCIAVHLRYGDACGHNANHTGRRCGPVAEYVRAVVEMSAAYGYTQVAVASDSAGAQASFLRRLPSGLNATLLTQPHQLYGDSVLAAGAMVEDLMNANATVAWSMLETFLLDVLRMARCEALVGKFTSNLSRLLFELMSARVGRVIPFVSLDAPWCFGARGTSPHGRGFFPC